jgi:hypothetical protein
MTDVRLQRNDVRRHRVRATEPQPADQASPNFADFSAKKPANFRTKCCELPNNSDGLAGLFRDVKVTEVTLCPNATHPTEQLPPSWKP